MRCFSLALIVFFAFGAAADGARGGRRPYGAVNRANRSGARGDWRTYGAVNRASHDGVWKRGYGQMGYGWYSVYGDYVGSDYSWINVGYRNRASAYNFNRLGNYGFSDPRADGDRPR